MVLLQFSERPVRSALFPIVPICLHSFFRRPNEIFGKRLLDESFGLHSMFELLQHIVSASVRVDVFVILKRRQGLHLLE